MITGDAGAGKTSVLQELVRTQAESFVKGKVECLYLYVNAQGRALARFTEAVAAELDELRSSLTFHEVTPLVRLGLIIPVIDGFDELLGVGGYDEAFSSLSAFVEELEGEGQLITSARSAYYEQEFVSRSGRTSSLGAPIWRQTSVQVLEWTPDESDEYVRRKCAAEGKSPNDTAEALSEVHSAFIGENQALATKPLFVAKALELVLSGERLDRDKGLLQSMVSIYLERERTEKLLDRTGKSLLLPGQIENLLIEVAEEMWNLETRELDTRSVRSIAEYVVETYGMGAGANVIVERMPTMAFLSPGGRRNSVAFEHETFFAYFLAARFAERLRSTEVPLHVLLARSAVSDDVASMTAQRIAPRVDDSRALGDVPQILERLSQAGALQSSRLMQVRENTGRIVQYLLKRICANGHPVPDLALSRFIFPGGDLKDVTLVRPQFREIEFRRVDLSHTRILAGAAEATTFFDVIVDRTKTRLELIGVDPRTGVIGIRVAGSDKREFDPAMVRNILVDIGLVAAAAPAPRTRSVHAHAVGLLERLVRAYGRANPICTSDDTLRSVFGDPMWAAMERCLIRSQVVSAESKNTSGRPKKFLRRLVGQEEFLAGIDIDAEVNSNIEKLWSMLEEEFPS